MKEPWSIKTRSRECAGSKRPFEDGETIFATIFPDPEASGYLRKDFSEEAWKERADDAEEPFSQWKTTYQAPVVEEKAEAVVQEDPETLLRRLVEEEEEHTENARYILAVMLERQKLLRETDTQQLPSGILRVYEHRKTGDVYIIKDPQIALADVEKVQDEVRELLDPQPEAEIEDSSDTEESHDSEEKQKDTDVDDVASAESSESQEEHTDEKTSEESQGEDAEEPLESEDENIED